MTETDATMATTLFAVQVQSPAAMATQLRRELDGAYPAGPPPGVDVDQLVSEAIAELWDCPVRLFIPVLALRAAREQLTAQGLAPCGASWTC